MPVVSEATMGTVRVALGELERLSLAVREPEVRRAVDDAVRALRQVVAEASASRSGW